MKFATLALIGTTSARRNLDKDVTETVKTLYPWDAVKEYSNQGIDIYRTLLKNEDKFEAMERKMEKKINRWVEKNGDKYVPEFMGWATSDAVQAKKRYEEDVIMNSKEMQELMDEGLDVWHQMVQMEQKGQVGKEATADGWVEWADNKEVMELFEEVYDVKEAFKKLVENKEMMDEKERLGMATLADPHFLKMW